MASTFGVLMIMFLGIVMSMVALVVELYLAWQTRMFHRRQEKFRSAMAASIRTMRLGSIFQTTNTDDYCSHSGSSDAHSNSSTSATHKSVASREW